MTTKAREMVVMAVTMVMMMFLMTTNASEGPSVHHHLKKRALCNGPRNNDPVKVCVKTNGYGVITAYGTVSQVYVRIQGTKCITTWLSLDNKHSYHFEQSTYVCINYYIPAIGTPVVFQVKVDPNTDHWYPKYFTVQFNQHCWTFYFDRWIYSSLPRTMTNPRHSMTGKCSTT
ncbi:hypothetical protein V1264_019611 [Littorina saxatilis]|uniref:Uncharacterized protein n=1 Tax=Littorina saxatilis TaxID=31220 RepID=A0AAN9BHI6_9CAEN